MFDKMKLNKKDGFITEFSDPFNNGSIESVSMHISKNRFEEGFRYWGIVKFKNNKTGGQQDFDADSFNELYVKIETFLKSI